MKLSAIVRRTRTSLRGHILLFEVLWGVPMSALGIWLNYDQGSLTPTWAAWCVFVAIVGALLVATLVWLSITKPMLLRRGDLR